MSKRTELRQTIKQLHTALNRWPHNTPEGREMRAHFGQRIEAAQQTWERLAEREGTK